MQCDCGGVLIEGKTVYRVSRDSFTLIIEHIPVFKCMRCERVLFTDEQAERLQKLVNRVERETRELISGAPSVNLYDY